MSCHVISMRKWTCRRATTFSEECEERKKQESAGKPMSYDTVSFHASFRLCNRCSKDSRALELGELGKQVHGEGKSQADHQLRDQETAARQRQDWNRGAVPKRGIHETR